MKYSIGTIPQMTSDMDETSEMRGDAVTQAKLAVQKHETEKDIAKHVGFQSSARPPF